jgi:hypothetical protein
MITSVTQVPCSCSFLKNALNDERFPIGFDAQVNEYFFEHKMPDGGTLSVRLLHCPMCGGVASRSTRDKMFADLSNDEIQRIHTKVGSYKSVADVERALGAPDLDQKGGPDSRVIRILTYKKLSKTADVQFSVYADGRIEGAIAPKQVATAERKRRTASKTKRKKKL